jgi:hypothetical protein
MSKTTGHTNKEGIFSLLATFDPRNSDDIEQMFKLLDDENMNAEVKEYGPDFVEVIYRPDRLSDYGFR